ncbi:MAG: DUF4870 domain-containing protein [Bacillus sp. (in: Bacteria)]|nr:DUF4870 domain-containing protein [Bacillus sp. (in: firmicutes)]
METNKILSSLCYFSIFFAGFIFPIVVYFVTNNPETKRHAKSAFLSHLIPFIGIVFIIMGLILDIGIFTSGSGIPFFFILSFVVYGILVAIVIMWNVIKGIKVLMN